MKLFILADDFTGAMDTGVQLSKAQIKTLVFSKIPSEKPDTDTCEVLVINTNLRHAEPKFAYTAICSLLTAYASPELHIYIKTDSAMRGNISAAIAAATETLGLPLHFIPAFPDARRTLRNGMVYIEDALLENSVFRKDPRSPMTESCLEKIVKRDFPVPCRLIKSNEKAGSNIPSNASKPDSSAGSGKPFVYLYDGSTNEDLVRIASILKKENQLKLTAGCAGFAKQFPKILSFEKEPPYKPSKPGPVLFLSGSANAITFRQLIAAQSANYPLFSIAEYLKASIENVPYAGELEDELAASAVDSLKNGVCTLLATAQSPNELLDFNTLNTNGRPAEAVHTQISQCCSKLVHRILDESGISYLTVFGGDTVAGILEELGCESVFAKGEISTGVPLCLFPYKGRMLHLVTKSGGLGCEDIVTAIDKYFNLL